MAELVDDGGWRAIFVDLARAEEHHKERLLEASRTMMAPQAGEIAGGGRGPEGLMEGAVKIDGALEWAGAPGRRPPEILELAMQVEADSLDLYLKIADRPEFVPVKEVLRALVDDEKRHLARMGELMERVTSPR